MIWIFLIVLAVLCALYVLSTMCRRGKKRMGALAGWGYAHRGLHGNGIPENSMAAFRKALASGYGIELDVHLLADGELAVIHDASLKRTAGADVIIEDLTLAQLADYRLEGTDEAIPAFREVLELFGDKAPLIVELKPNRGNHAELAKAACELLDKYNCQFCIESFDPRCIGWLKKHRPQVIRGQLAQNFLHIGKSNLPWIVRFAVTHQIENFLIRPDFVAYKFAHRKQLGNFLARKLWGAQGVTWTITSQKDYDTAVTEGWIPIFEGFEP